MEPENTFLKKSIRFLALALNIGLIILATILAPDTTGLSWPAYLLSPLFMVGTILAVIAYAAIGILALAPPRHHLETHSRTAAVISMICCILYIGGNVVWGLGTLGNFAFDQRYVIPAIFIGFWLVYFASMQSLRQASPLRRIKIGMAVTIPILLIACLGTYVNLASIFSPQGYYGYFYTRNYLAYLLINTFLFCMLFGMLWEAMRQRFIAPIEVLTRRSGE